MSNVLNFNLAKVVKIPDSVMMLESHAEFSVQFDKVLDAAKFKKGRPVFFQIGEEVNGKFVPCEDNGASPEQLMSAYLHYRRALGEPDGFGFYACQKVKSVKELRK